MKEINPELGYTLSDKFTPISVDADIDMEFTAPDNWYDYEAQKAVALPPVGEKVEGVTSPSFSPFKCTFVGIDSRGDIVVEKLDEDFYRYKQDQITLMPLDYNRKAEAERTNLLEIVCRKWDERGDIKEVAEHLHDKGYLRTPSE